MLSQFSKFEFKNHPQAQRIAPLFKLIEDELHQVEHLHQQLKYIDEFNQEKQDLRAPSTDEYFDLMESVFNFSQRRLIEDQEEDPDEIKTQGTCETQAPKVYECCGKRWKTGRALGGHRQKAKLCPRRKIRHLI